MLQASTGATAPAACCGVIYSEKAMQTAEDQGKGTLRKEEAKEYNRIKIRLSIIDLLITITLIIVLAFSGLSRMLVQAIQPYTGNPYLQFLIFIAIVGLAAGIIGFPLTFYGSYLLEHRFGLSTQTIFSWLFDRIKSLGVGLALGIPVAIAFYYFLVVAGTRWWLYFSVFIFLFTVLLARIAPVIIFPLFYTFTPLEEGAIQDKIFDIIRKHNISIRGIYSFNMSKETKKANAGFTGIGRSKRIILSDTLIENFSPDEIAVIFSHEVGHYTKRHIIKNILLSGIVVFSTFFLCGQLYEWTLPRYGFVYIHEIAATPILFFYLSLTSLIAMPLVNALSRHYEWEADRFALALTEDRTAFISGMEKLAEINLADREPHPIIEFLFYSHPSIKKRIDAARTMAFPPE
jgi:STE24 endopeptidase